MYFLKKRLFSKDSSLKQRSLFASKYKDFILIQLSLDVLLQRLINLFIFIIRIAIKNRPDSRWAYNTPLMR